MVPPLNGGMTATGTAQNADIDLGKSAVSGACCWTTYLGSHQLLFASDVIWVDDLAAALPRSVKPFLPTDRPVPHLQIRGKNGRGPYNKQAALLK